MTSKRSPAKGSGDVGAGNMFRSISSFLEVLSDLAERAEESGGEFTRGGELGDEKKGVKAVYGLSVRFGGSGKPSIEQFGNVKRGGRGAVVEEAREPMVDVFDEGELLVVVAELPGVNAADVEFEVKDDVLVLSASSGERKYHKEVVLSSPVNAQTASSSYRNGVYELRLPKAAK